MEIVNNKVLEVNSLIRGNALLLGKKVGVETISVVKLDDIIRDDEEVHLLKIDVQGYEPSVLDGAKKTLRSGRVDLITFEYWPTGIRRGNVEPSKMLKDLWFAGYQCFDWSGNMHVKDSRPSEINLYAQEFEDAIFWGGTCETKKCLEFGWWDEMVCAQLKK